MGVFNRPDFDDHEDVHVFHDAKSGLRAIIAIHSTNLGPAAGGTRLWTYASDEDALDDALRLAKAMSYKNAMAGIPFGGGKGVILRPEGDFDREALFTAYGKAVNNLGGRYCTAEDVGVSPEDMKVIRAQTPFVGGLDEGSAASGDPSPVTADGVFRGLHVAVRQVFGTDNLTGFKVAVQGLGHVGYNLCERLHKVGAKLIVADINSEVVKRAEDELGAVSCDPATIHAADVDIFAPCALSGAINPDTIEDIKAKIVGGAANNQLSSPNMGQALRERGILYCPDYVLNGGGIINVAAELSGQYDPTWVDGKLDELCQTLTLVFDEATRHDMATNHVADEMARKRIDGIISPNKG